MKRNKAQKDILYISISSFVLVVLWIGFNLYHAYVTSTISHDLKLQIEPISPNFDSATIQKLNTRKQISPVFEVKNASGEASITPSPSVQEIPLGSSRSGSLTPVKSIERVGQ